MRIIITGATGMVGEGVLLQCLTNNSIEEILLISRKHYKIQHTKVKELIVADFLDIEKHKENLMNYDACFFCAGVSSIGMKEEKYSFITYTTTISFAKVLAALSTNMVFTYVSGIYTDSTEKGKLMWARVKGKTENDLMKLPFKKVYNFRPGFLLPIKNQQNVKPFVKALVVACPYLFPSITVSLQVFAQAMINIVSKDYEKQILEVSDIKKVGSLSE